MSLNSTPSAERLHIGIFGRTNAGKSSIINAVTKQSAAIVSDVKGTTTDPVYKSMELLPVGPVVFIDTPGLDDDTALGKKRVERTELILAKTDIALLISDALTLTEQEKELLNKIEELEIPYIHVINKADLLSDEEKQADAVFVSAVKGDGIEELKQRIIKAAGLNSKGIRIIGDFIERGDIIVLVVPIDSAAPKGRLILPQQQTLRDILDSGAIAVVTRETELKQALAALAAKPKMVVCDSQAFETVSHDTPEDIILTSFSILFSRYKGGLDVQLKAVNDVKALKNGDKILIAEGCTHHRQCDDIGTVKIPKWLESYTGKSFDFEFSSGASFPEEIERYSLIVHCGGCMLNDREMQRRIRLANSKGIPICNYGLLIAYLKGTLDRSLKLFSKEK